EAAALLADVMIVARLRLGAEQEAQVACASAVGDGTPRLHLVVQITISIDLIGNTGTVHGLEQHHVYDLAAAADIQLAGSATYDIDIVDLRGTDPRQHGAGLIILARHALAVDQNLLFTATAQTTGSADFLGHTRGRAYPRY